MKYFNFISDKKHELDEILVRHKAQPVGWGDIDTIVHRNELEKFVESISKYGFLIKTVSWWEYLSDKDQTAKIGMGGPISWFYPGWFSEINEYDEIEEEFFISIMNDQKVELVAESNNRFFKNILTKTTKAFGGNSLSYQKDLELTAGLWLEVPDEWINPFTKSDKTGFLPEYRKLVEENRRKIFV
jgi:hypothetical protein